MVYKSGDRECDFCQLKGEIEDCWCEVIETIEVSDEEVSMIEKIGETIQ